MLVQHFLDAQQALSAHQKRHIDVLTTGLPLELEMGVDFGWGHAKMIGDQGQGHVTKGHMSPRDYGPAVALRPPPDTTPAGGPTPGPTDGSTGFSALRAEPHP